MEKGLIVSCQALEDEPLHSAFIMGRMAIAAKEGGAIGIRANSCVDIKEILSMTQMPVIGIIKKDYEGSDVYITATMDEVDQLVLSGASIIALDATANLRPEGISLETFYHRIKLKYPDIVLMADCSTVAEALFADTLGFDYIGTTLVGYTEQSKQLRIEADDFKIIRDILSQVKAPVIAEGNIDTPVKARRVLELGCRNVVVGSIITRPQIITQLFTDEINKGEKIV